MQRIALKIMASAAIAGFGLAGMPGPADAAAAPPACGNPAPVTAHLGSSTWIPLGMTCQDADLDHLAFEIVTPPEHGELTSPDVGGQVEYTPDAGYLGEDSFQFRANDGDEVSETLTIAITVEPNRPPVCEPPMTMQAEPGMANPVWVWCWDPDSCCELTYSVVDPPQHGTVGPPDPWGQFSYTPEAGYHGRDSFTFTAGDGLDDSDVATVDITVLGPNSAPTCASPLTLRVPVNGTLPLTALTACSDPDGDPVSPVLVTGPRHGKLAFPEGGIAYVPDRDYAGADRIDYRVVDPRGARSDVAVIDIVVGDDPSPVVTTSKLPDRLAPTASIVAKPGQRLRDVRTRGLKLLVASSEAGQVAVRLSVSKATARRLKLARKPQGRVSVGFADRSIRAGTTTVSVALGPKTRRAFRRIGRVKLLVAATVTDRAGNSAAVAEKLRLRRR